MATSSFETAPARGHHNTLRVPRSRGALSGLLIMVLGVWAAVVPFIGPYFDYAFESNDTWRWTNARFWLEVLPGAAAVLGGLLVVISVNRVVGSLGGWLAAGAGAWLIVGPTLSGPLPTGSVGAPLSTTESGRAAEAIGFFYGVGALIVFLAAFALGRLAVVGLRDVRAAETRDSQRVAERARARSEAADVAAGDADARESEPRQQAYSAGGAERDQATRYAPANTPSAPYSEAPRYSEGQRNSEGQRYAQGQPPTTIR